MMQDEEGELIEEPQGNGSKGVIIGVVIVVTLVLFAGIGKISGTGWFGHRSFLYEGGELYVLNMHVEPRYVSVDGLERVEVPAQNAQRVDLIGGTSEVVITTEDGEVAQTHSVTIDGSDALLKLGEQKCLAVMDLSGIYGSGASGAPKLREGIREKDDLYIPQSRNVVWPRKDFPKGFSPQKGLPLWIEIVGCELLDDPEFLEPYLGNRMQKKLKEQENPDGMPVRQRL